MTEPSFLKQSAFHTYLFGLTFGLLCFFVYLFPEYYYHWDEIQLALGAKRFDLTWHQPHAPGYYLFVMSVRFVDFLNPTSIPSGRLVSSLSACGVFLLVGRECLRISQERSVFLWLLACALFLAFSPLLLFYSVSHLTYITEGFLWLLLLLLLKRVETPVVMVGIAFLIGVSGGFRQTLLVWGFSFWLVFLWIRFPKNRLILFFSGSLACALGIGLWFIPMMLETGGWEAYRAATDKIVRTNILSKSLLGAPSSFWIKRLGRMGSDLFQGLGLWSMLVVTGLAMRFSTKESYKEALRPFDPILFGGFFSFLFYYLLIYDTSGYACSFLLLWFAYGAFTGATVLNHLSKNRKLIFACGGCALALLMLWQIGDNIPHVGAGVYRRYDVHNRDLKARIKEVTKSFRPSKVLLLSSREYWDRGFRHLMYYLPEYPVLQLEYDPRFVAVSLSRPYLLGHRRKVSTIGPDGVSVRELASKMKLSFRKIVYVYPRDIQFFFDRSCLEQVKFKLSSFGKAKIRIAVIHMKKDWSYQIKEQKLVCIENYLERGT